VILYRKYTGGRDNGVAAHGQALRPAELASVSVRGGSVVFGVAANGAIWQLLRWRTPPTGGAEGAGTVEERARVLVHPSDALGDVDSLVAVPHGAGGWLLAFRTAAGMVHTITSERSGGSPGPAARFRSWPPIAHTAHHKGGAWVAARQGSLCALPAARTAGAAVFFLDPEGAVHELLVLQAAEQSRRHAAREYLSNNLTAAAIEAWPSLWRPYWPWAAPDSALCCIATGATGEGARRVYWVDAAGGVNELRSAVRRGPADAAWVTSRLSDHLAMDAAPASLACPALQTRRLSVYFAAPPTEMRSCLHDEGRSPRCHNALHVLELDTAAAGGERWREGTLTEVEFEDPECLHRGLHREISPALGRPLVVPRPHGSSVVYVTASGALHEVFWPAAGAGGGEASIGDAYLRLSPMRWRREVTAHHSHPELFAPGGSKAGAVSLALGAEVGVEPEPGMGAVYVLGADGRLLSF
jgi:hypothetical protein